MTRPMHQAEERPADLTRRGTRALVELWRIPAGACVTMPWQSVHGRDCPDQIRARRRVLDLPTPSDATEATILRQRRAWANTFKPQSSIHFRVQRLKDGQFIWASSTEGDDAGAAVSLALRIAGEDDYFVAVALARRDAQGETVEKLDGEWTMRRCRVCAARCMVPTGQDLCPLCADEREAR